MTSCIRPACASPFRATSEDPVEDFSASVQRQANLRCLREFNLRQTETGRMMEAINFQLRRFLLSGGSDVGSTTRSTETQISIGAKFDEPTGSSVAESARPGQRAGSAMSCQD